MKMNYRKSLFITLLSVSVLGTATNANVFADQQSEKPGVTQPAKSNEKGATTASSSSAKTPAVKAAEPTKQTGKAAQKNVTITLNPYVVGRSLNITGSYDGTNAVYLRAEVNGQKKALVSSKELASGKINYYVGNLKATDKAEIVLFNKDYQEIGRQQVTIKEPVKTQITLEPYVVGRSLNITGNYNGTNAVYMRAEVNGQKKGLVSSKGLTSGKISYYVGNLKATDKAEIVLFDKNYQEIGRQVVPFSVNQVFYFNGVHLSNESSDTRVTLTAKNQHVVIQEVLPAGHTAQVHPGFGSQFYFSIAIKNPQGQWITHLNWSGDYWSGHVVNGSYDVPNGSTVQISHREASTRFNTNDNSALKNKAGITYTYKMENNRLVLVGVSQDYLA